MANRKVIKVTFKDETHAGGRISGPYWLEYADGGSKKSVRWASQQQAAKVASKLGVEFNPCG